jgi:hypothetical protein
MAKIAYKTPLETLSPNALIDIIKTVERIIAMHMQDLAETEPAFVETRIAIGQELNFWREFKRAADRELRRKIYHHD